VGPVALAIGACGPLHQSGCLDAPPECPTASACLLAALCFSWALWRDKQAGETVKSCAMIVTDANDFVAEVHDRMPVILEPDQHEPWLMGNAGVDMLKPAADHTLQRWPVSKRVNSSRANADDATLSDPLAGGGQNTAGAGLFA
jgi:hypothetical protein